MTITHDISIVGYGEEDGTKYWTVRNSWGTQFGESGFVRVIRGTNNLNLESDCAWATPKDTWSTPVIHKTTDEEKNDPRNLKHVVNGPYPERENGAPFLSDEKNHCRRVAKATWTMGEKKPAMMAWEEVSADQVPQNMDWRNVNDTNYLSWSKNQHIPVYCGSCWAQGSTSALADRFNILLGDLSPTPVALNAQVMINCRAGGTCNGGDPSGVYEYAYTHGIPDSSCEQYTAMNLDKRTCDPIDVCRECQGPPPAEGEPTTCWAVTNFRKYYASDYYSLRGADQMKAEIYKYGPISCGLMVTDDFQAYTGGIYSEKKRFPMINHEISIVGYGMDEATKEEYWIGRNSWGTYWGERGFFRIKMHSDNLAVETDCTAGRPSFTKPGKKAEEFVQ